MAWQWKEREDTPFNFRWPNESVFALGIYFSNCKKVSDNRNFYDKLDALENTLNNWKRRKLTLLRKINIVKSLGLSKLIFNASVLPIPEKFSDQVNKITFSFIWDNKTAKIKKTTLIGEKENGSLNMIDFSLVNKALKCLWVKRFSLNENTSWTVIAHEATSLLEGFNFLVTCNCKILTSQDYQLFIKKLLNTGLNLKTREMVSNHVQ